MSDVNTRKQDEAGKTEQRQSREELGYDYNHAISEVTRLWNDLKTRHASRGWKYLPRDAAFEYLLSAWRIRPGKSLVHLFDLPDFVHVTLDAKGIGLLMSEWRKLVAKYTFRGASTLHAAIYSTTIGKHQTTSIDELRKLTLETGTSFEEYVVAIRPGAYGKSFSTRLPLRIDSEPFGELFGFYGDLMHQKVGHVTKDKQVQEEFVRTVGRALGEVDVSTRAVGEYTSTYSTTTIKHLLSIGGLDTSVRQLRADNPAPLFLFESPDSVVREYLRSLFESEGGVSYNKKRNMPGSVDLHQAVICSPPEKYTIPRHPGKVYYTQIGSPANLLDTPPRLLIAASLLLVRFDISSHLYPASLYTNDLNEKVMRWRLVITGTDIETYRLKIGFISTRKQNKLLPGTPSSPSSSFSSMLCLR
jgi:LAGLIDADG-like domain